MKWKHLWSENVCEVKRSVKWEHQWSEKRNEKWSEKWIRDVNNTCRRCEWHVCLNSYLEIFVYKKFLFFSTSSFLFISSSSVYFLLLTFVVVFFLLLFSSSSAQIRFIFVFVLVFERSIHFSFLSFSFSSVRFCFRWFLFYFFLSFYFLFRNSICQISHFFVSLSFRFDFVTIKMSQNSITIEQNSFCQICFKFFVKNLIFVCQKKIENKLCFRCAKLQYNCVEMSRNRNVFVSFTKLTSLNIEKLLYRNARVCSRCSRFWFRKYFDLRTLLWRYRQRWSRCRQDCFEKNNKNVKFQKQEFYSSLYRERFEQKWQRRQ